jgi:alpha-beta hydrolase superfamily lysophospholipase
MRHAGTLAVVSVLAAALGGCTSPPYFPQRTGSLGTRVPPEIEYWNGYFFGAGDVHLYEQSWRPTGPVRAAVVLLHGLKDHSSRYRELAIAFAHRGVSVYAFDLRGHGYSEGVRDHIQEVDSCLADLRAFLPRVRDRDPGKPVFLLGQGFGATLAALYATQGKPELAGLVLSAPAMRARVERSERFGTRMTALFAPKSHRLQLDLARWSSDPDVVASLRGDPLIYGGEATAGTARALLEASDELERREAQLALPLLILHGTGDKIIDPDVSRTLHQRAKAADKDLRLYPGLYHDLFHEPGHDQVVADVLGWVQKHASAAAPPPKPAPPSGTPPRRVGT